MSVYGGAGWELREKGWQAPFFGGLLVALIGFSRNFLGVHTPQDVIAGILEGALVIWLAGVLLTWLEASDEGQSKVIAFGAAIITVIYLAFVTLKRYPVSSEAGTAAPMDMLLDAYEAAGLFLAVPWAGGSSAATWVSRSGAAHSRNHPLRSRRGSIGRPATLPGRGFPRHVHRRARRGLPEVLPARPLRHRGVARCPSSAAASSTGAGASWTSSLAALHDGGGDHVGRRTCRGPTG